MDRWSQLSLKDKSDLMSLYIQNGISSLEEIKKHYNSFATGGIVDGPPIDPVLKGRQPKANFYQRLLNPFRQTMPDWENRINNQNNVATHKISWATDNNGNAIVYPDVQEINGKLYDFTDPRNKEGRWAAYDRAVQTGDTIQMTPEQANFWTQHYKEFYPNFNYATGGSLPDHDPDNPYHYHNAEDEKIVITPEDWEANVGKPYFKEIEDAVRAEQAAHPSPEYDIQDNPAFIQAYNNLKRKAAGNQGALAVNWWNGNSWGYAPLPKGYTRDKYGVVTDTQGNYYTPLPNRNNSSFSTPYRDLHGYTTEQYYGQVTMPEKTISILRQPLPINRTLDINYEKERAIKEYINNNSIKENLYYIPWFEDPNGSSIHVYGNPKALSSPHYLNGNANYDNWYVFDRFNNDIDEADQYSYANTISESEIKKALQTARGINSLFTPIDFWFAGYDNRVPSRQEAEQNIILPIE